jgi:type IV pilus biogenesis/stability protein PilW
MKVLNVVVLVLVCSFLSCSGKQRQSAASFQAEPMSEQAAIQYQFAFEFYQRGDLIRALTAALRATELSPKNPDVRNLLGLIYFRQQDYPKAEQSFQSAIELNPKMSEAFNNLGTLYYDRGRLEEAEKALLAALENPLYLYPERIYNNLGLVYASLKLGQQAREAYEKAIRLRPDYYLPYLNLGKLWMEEGGFNAARPLLREAERLCGFCSEPKYQLAQVLLNENQRLEAEKLLKEVFELDPRGYYGQLARRFLIEHGKIKDE